MAGRNAEAARRPAAETWCAATAGPLATAATWCLAAARPLATAARRLGATAVVLGVAVALVVCPAPAPAQAPPAADTTALGDTIVLQGVDVTVLRATTPVSAAPMAVSVLTRDELRRGRSGAFLEEALRGLPGVQVQNRFNPAVGERVAIRGFGARAQFGMRGIRVVVDGIPATLPDGQSTLDHLDIGSLGRVEVVRGPTSALFGNASGGVLAFYTQEPVAAPFQGEVEQVFGSHGLARTQTTASGTVNETSYLVSLSRVGWDGYRTVVEGEGAGDTYGASERLALNSRLSRPFAGGEISLTLNAADLDAENPGSVTAELRDDPDRPVVPLYLTHVTGKEVRQAQGGLRWEGPVGEALDADLSLFGVRRSVVNPIPFNLIDLSRSAAGVRARLGRTDATGWGELRLQAGVEYELQDDERVELGRSFQGELGDEPHTDQAEDVRSQGLFLQANLALPGGSQALAGLRYDRHRFTADDRIERDEGDFSATGRRSMEAVSPSVGISTPLGSDVNLFASLGTVFETPSTTELKNRPDGAGGFNPELEPQRGTAAEVGIRSRLGPRAAMELTAYRTDLRNELIPFEVPAVEGQVFFRNVGSSRHTGIEATLSAASTTGLVRGDLTYSLANARFRSYELDGEELGGNRVPGLAPNRAQGTLRASPGTGFGAVTGTWVDAVPVNDQNTASAPSYFLVDLNGGLEGVEVGSMALHPWVAITNVLDRHYTASAAVNAAGSRYFEPGPGRSFQVGMRAVF